MGDSKSDEIVETVVTKLLKVGENSRGKIDAKADGKLTEKEIEVVLETVRGMTMPTARAKCEFGCMNPF